MSHKIMALKTNASCFRSCVRYSLLFVVISFISIKTGQSCLSDDMTVVNNSCLNSRKIPLYIGGMMSITVGWDGTGCLVAAEYALEQINNRQDILPEYELIMLWNDTQCANDKPLRALYDQIVVSEQTKVAILGPSCSPGVDHLAATSKHWNLLTVLFAAYSPTLSNRVRYPNVYRTVPIGTNVFSDPYIWLIKEYGWSRVGFISKSAISFSMIQDDFVEKASKINVSVVTELIQDSAKNQVENLKNLDIRIIFFYTFEPDTREILCEAYKIGLSGPNIVWVMPSWFQDKWWLIDDEKVDCTVQELADMVESSLIIGVDVQAFSPLNRTTVAGTTPAEYLDEVTERLKWHKYRNYTLNNYMAYTYDAVWAIALMLNSSATKLKEGKSNKRLEDFSYTDTDMYDLFFHEMAASDFFGASGYVNFVKGERLGTSEISQLRGQCQMGWTLYKHHCYKFSMNNSSDWNTASTSCAEEGAYLTDITTESDLYILKELWSSIMNDTLFKWYVGYHSVHAMTDDKTESTTMDVQDIPSGGEFAESDPEEASKDCPYVDFKDSKPLKKGYCQEERNFICKRNADFGFVSIAMYESISDKMIWSDEIRWLDGKVPLDRKVYIDTVIEKIELLLPGYIHIILSILAVSGMAIVLINTLFTIWFSERRDYSVFHPSHPILSYIILFGCFLLYSSTMLTKSQLLSYITDKHLVLLCQIRDITASIGFTVGVSTLVGKVWLVYKATALKSPQETMISETRLIYPMIAFFVCVDVICLVIRHLCYPLNTTIIPLGEEVDPSNPHIVKMSIVKTCASIGDGTLPRFLIFVDKIILLLLGLFLSFEIRNVPSLGDSRQVTLSIYNVVIFGACGLILVILLENDPINSFLFSSALVICCTTILLMIMFLPKIISRIRHLDHDFKQDDTSNAGSSSLRTEKCQSQESSHDINLKFCGNVPRELREENRRLMERLRELQELLQEKGCFVKALPPSGIHAGN